MGTELVQQEQCGARMEGEGERCIQLAGAVRNTLNRVGHDPYVRRDPYLL